jgi:hypothetical protein
LRDSDSIYYLNIDKKDMREWLKEPWNNESYITVANLRPNATISDDLVDQATTEAGKIKKGKLSQAAFRLSLITNSDLVSNTAFFYLSDLIDAAMSNIEESLSTEQKPLSTTYFNEVIATLDTFSQKKIIEYIVEKQKNKKYPKNLATLEQFKKLRIVLGPMEITPYAKSLFDKRAISCTIGDIPISLTYFLDFMSSKVLAKDFIEYPFAKFIKDIINDCIRNFINSDGCFASNASQKVSLNSTTVLAYNSIKNGSLKDDLSNLILESGNKYSSKNCLLLNKVPTTKLPILKISGPTGDERKDLGVNNMINYFIFAIGRRYPIDEFAGNRTQDSEKGVFHYVLGENRGIVRNISLDKTTTPGLKELRFEQEGFDGLEQLREVYNANITTFLNPQTFPGTYIYVDPKGFDPTSTEDLSRYGIGGYYMITKTTHQIVPGDAETSINAAWVASKGGKIIKGENGEPDRRNEEPGNSENAKICRVRALKETSEIRDTSGS